MGFILNKEEIEAFISSLQKTHKIFAPKVFVGQGKFSDTDSIGYGEVSSIDEIVFNEKSDFSFKEVILPVIQTLFFFTEDTVKEENISEENAIVFLRSCDLHGLKILDEMYMENVPEDYYYNKLRSKVKFVLMGCENSFDNCFCVSMGTNVSEEYSMSIDSNGDMYSIDCKENSWSKILKKIHPVESKVTPMHVTKNNITVSIPENLFIKVHESKIWDEYDKRCINCGRCNFVCPTCTCFTMQDMFYTENGKVGERRRVWASCMVDGFTDVAGGGGYRKKNGERMRFKMLHKVLDYKERNGHHMCVGCGRCDDVCPEYISFSNNINKLEAAMKEVNSNDK